MAKHAQSRSANRKHYGSLDVWASRSLRLPGARRCWRRWFALVAVIGALMLAGCAPTASSHAGATSSVTPVPPAPTLPVAWQAATAPGSAVAPLSYMPAPSDARVTYACGFTPSAPNPNARIWRTTDRGATWAGPVTLPFTDAITKCAITVDADDPQRVVVVLNTARMGANLKTAAELVAFISQDGGATWRLLPQAGPHGFMSLASYHGALYAGGYGLSASGADLRDVWVSGDSGVSWRALGAAELAENPYIWINPQTGELLGSNESNLIPTLWRSEDGGASWKPIATPSNVGAGSSLSYVIAANGTGWRTCATGLTAPGPQEKVILECSDDLGATWMTPPTLGGPLMSARGLKIAFPSELFGAASDGTLLADDYTATGLTLVALAPDSNGWEGVGPYGAAPDYIGHLPVDCAYTASPGSGMLWVGTDDRAHPFATSAYP